jgi:hypothetical protein
MIQGTDQIGQEHDGPTQPSERHFASHSSVGVLLVKMRNAV